MQRHEVLFIEKVMTAQCMDVLITEARCFNNCGTSMMVLKRHHEKMKQFMPRMQAQVCKERIVTFNGMVIAEYLPIKNLPTSTRWGASEFVP